MSARMFGKWLRRTCSNLTPVLEQCSPSGPTRRLAPLQSHSDTQSLLRLFDGYEWVQGNSTLCCRQISRKSRVLKVNIAEIGTFTSSMMPQSTASTKLSPLCAE